MNVDYSEMLWKVKSLIKYCCDVENEQKNNRLPLEQYTWTAMYVAGWSLCALITYLFKSSTLTSTQQVVHKCMKTVFT